MFVNDIVYISVAIDCEMDVTPKASPMSCHNDLPKSSRCARMQISTITIAFLGKLRITTYINILHIKMMCGATM